MYARRIPFPILVMFQTYFSQIQTSKINKGWSDWKMFQTYFSQIQTILGRIRSTPRFSFQTYFSQINLNSLVTAFRISVSNLF